MTTDELRARAHRLIPGGAHTYSKGDDQFPANAPAFIARGQGCHVWDNEGREWLDWGMGLRSVILGHAYPRVVEAVKAELDKGSNFTRPSIIEAELAELFLSLFPNSNDLMVKFAKNGSDVTSAAVRLARAWTGKSLILACSSNPFYSFNDWWIGTTEMSNGVPPQDHVDLFDYGDLATMERCCEELEVAAIIVEPAATAPVDIDHGEYLEQMRDIAHRHGALLIFDEMLTGFRWDLPGAQTYYGVEPDLSCFGKAMANGFSVSALVGRRDIMELGGIRQKERPRAFLLSATHGGETHAMAAAIATIREMQRKDVLYSMHEMARTLQDGLNLAIEIDSMQEHVRCIGHPMCPMLNFSSLGLQTLFQSQMCERGILMPYLAPSLSHTVEDAKHTAEAARQALYFCHGAIKSGILNIYQEVGPPIRPVFRRYN